MIPIYVPSKGRPDSSTMRLLQEEGIPFTAVIEEEELEAYGATRPQGKNKATRLTMILPASNRGLAYSRQYILNNARTAGSGWFWMLDDDIKGIYQRDTDNKKCTKSTFKAMFRELNPIIEQMAHAQVSIEYQQYAWSTKRFGVFNSYCDVAVAINQKKASIATYNHDRVLKEDRDFTLQLLATGMTVFRFQTWAFSAPKNGSNKGGLADLYAKKGREEEAVDRMVKAWPGVVTKQIKSDGRVDCKIDWSLFRL